MEQSLSALTYKGSIPAAITEAKKQRKLFVVYISGGDAESSRLDHSTWTDSKVAESVMKYCILLHLSEGSNDATQFSAIYPQKSIPCITAVGYNGVQLWQNEGFISAEVLASNLEKVWLSLHIQDTTAAVLSAALASKTSEPSTSGVLSTASSDHRNSDVVSQSPLIEGYGESPDTSTEVSPDKAKEHKSDVCTVEKSCEFGGGETSSTSVDASEAQHAGSEKSHSSIEASEELPHSAIVDQDNARAVEGSHSPDKFVTDSNLVVSGGGLTSMNTVVNDQVVQDAKDEAEADKRVSIGGTANKSSDVYLNIRMPNGVNLQEKFSVTSTLRMVKDYVDERRDNVIGSYDLAIPYPRKVYSDQDLSRTLSELGLFNRQALIVVPRQRTNDQSNPRNIADSSNESNEVYFSYVKRLLSFINPLSYLGGGSSSTSDGQEAQHGMWEYSPNSALRNNFTQEQRPESISSGNKNEGKGRRPTTSRIGSNIHTLKRDEDDGRFSDRNSFWNGNSTQYGGNDNEK